MTTHSDAELIAEARANSTGNRKAAEASKLAGCFSCCRVFRSKEVVDWRDEWQSAIDTNRRPRWTALCPRCGNATVIADSTGLLNHQAYLPAIDDIFRKLDAKN